MFKDFLDRAGPRPPARRGQLPRRPRRAGGRRERARPQRHRALAGRLLDRRGHVRLHPAPVHVRRRPRPATRPAAERLAHTRSGRRLVYGVLMAHPGPGTRRPRARRRPRVLARPAGAADPARRSDPFDGEIAPDVPVTIAWAARDLVLPPWQAEVAKRTVPQAEHVMMRGVGHVPMWDDPDQVARVLLRGSAPVAEVAPLQRRPGRPARAAASPSPPRSPPGLSSSLHPERSLHSAESQPVRVGSGQTRRRTAHGAERRDQQHRDRAVSDEASRLCPARCG